MLTVETKETLLTTRPFRYLDLQEINMVGHYCRFLQFTPGQFLLHQGKRGEGMIIIIHGAAEVSAKVLGKDRLNFALLEQGNFIGEGILFEKISCAVSVIAKDDLTCILLSTNYFDMLALFFPEIRYKISKAITEEVCTRIQLTYQRVLELMTSSRMVKQSLFGEVVKSFNKAGEITDYAAVNMDINQLAESDFFKHLTPEEFSEVMGYTTLLNAPKNCVLIKEGELNSSYFIVLRGAVQVSIAQQGRFAKLAVLGPLEIFGCMSFIVERPSFLTYTTCERAVLLKISTEHLTQLKNHHVELWYKIFDSICKSFVMLERAGDKLIIRLNSELYNR